MAHKTLRLVTHVRKEDGCITYLKVDETAMTRDACVREIKSELFRYKTSPPSGLPGAEIGVRTRLDGSQYLRTTQDDDESNNLGGLPEF
jgi:hypothetical protein